MSIDDLKELVYINCEVSNITVTITKIGNNSDRYIEVDKKYLWGRLNLKLGSILWMND